jgi:hypothetical protein
VLAKPFDELREAQEALRERNFMEFNPDALTSINLSEEGRQIRLQKIETGNWQVIESTTDTSIQPRRADPNVMAQVIRDLKTLRASGFAIDTPSPTDLERLGFNQPRRTVILSSSENEDSTLLLAHPETENEKLYARSDQAEFIYEVERRPTLRMLPLNALHYRNRDLDILPEAAVITALKLENLATGETILEYDINDTTSLWANVLADSPEEEGAAILSLIESVRKFRVKTYLKDGYTETYTLDSEKSIPWAYRLSAQISLPGGEIARSDSRSYVFTERLSGTVQVGASKLHDTIFEISQSTIDALYELTTTMKLPPEMKEEPVSQPTKIEPVSEPTSEPASANASTLEE